MTNEQQRSPIFCLDKLNKHLYNTIWGIKQLLMAKFEEPAFSNKAMDDLVSLGSQKSQKMHSLYKETRKNSIRL
jgi:hypothetical protein